MNNIIGLYRRRMMMSALSSGIDVAALSITYTGAHTDYGMVTMSDGARYRLLAFTSSGTLSIEQPVNCEVCVVGGGANGEQKGANSWNTQYAGGAGAYMKNQVIEAFDGGPIVVGAAQGASSIGGVSVAVVSSQNGGTGGGGHGFYGITAGGTGDGLSKYPFGDRNYDLWAGKPHCAGGGGGGYFHPSNGEYKGGNGGTNGSNGSNGTAASAGEAASPGTGGSYGGGNGGNASYDSWASGENATYYGSGGGSKGFSNGFYSGATYGSGYQGIVYVRIPLEQEKAA